jgi:WD40 repeat protein
MTGQPMRLIIMGMVMAISACAISTPAKSDQSVTGAQVPVPRLQKTIELSDFGPATSLFRRMTFSPDGRFLAIVYNSVRGKTEILVWDVQSSRKQTIIHPSFNYGEFSTEDILWLPSNVICFGAKEQWNPMTGDSVPDNPAIGWQAKLNKDGSKMLTIDGRIGSPSYIHIYDTNTWELQRIYADGLSVSPVSGVAWTAENKILLAVRSTRQALGANIDGYSISNPSDVALRLIDPAAPEKSRSRWFPAERETRPKYPPWRQSIDITLGPTGFAKNQIALGSNRIIDGGTLEISEYYSIDDVIKDRVSTGTGGEVFTPDGRFLLLKSLKPSSIVFIDTSTGHKLSEMAAGWEGIAISKDAKTLAVGNRHSVQLFSFE